MNPDPRCCGSGTCIIDDDGHCWCGQQWDGQKMCHAPLRQAQPNAHAASDTQPGEAAQAPPHLP